MNKNACTYIDYAAAAKQRKEWLAWLKNKAEERRMTSNDKKEKP